MISNVPAHEALTSGKIVRETKVASEPEGAERLRNVHWRLL
jgi:hypothetical protein